MNDAEITALLDSHDALVTAVVAGDLPFAELVTAYGDFPTYALDVAKVGSDAEPTLRRVRSRMEFHRQVSGVLAGVRSGQSAAIAIPDAAGGFLAAAVFHRLRQLVARYPHFKAE